MKFEILKDSEGLKKEVITSHIYLDKFINLMMSRIILMVKADRDKLRLLNTRCTVLVCTVNPHNSRIEGSSNFQNHSFQFGNNRLDVKLWFPLEMVDSACTSWFSLYEKVWSRMHEKRERTCPVYQKVPFVPPFFAEREDPPEQKILRKPRTWPSVAVSTYFAFIVSKTWQIRATSGNRVPIWTEIEV